MRLKVFGGHYRQNGIFCRAVMASHTMMTISTATGEPIGVVRKFWSLSRDANEIEAAMAAPGVLLIRGDLSRPIFKRVTYEAEGDRVRVRVRQGSADRPVKARRRSRPALANIGGDA